MTNILCAVTVSFFTNFSESPIYKPLSPPIPSAGPGHQEAVGKRRVCTVIRTVIWAGGGMCFTNSDVIHSSTIEYEYRPVKTNINFQLPPPTK